MKRSITFSILCTFLLFGLFHINNANIRQKPIIDNNKIEHLEDKGKLQAREKDNSIHEIETIETKENGEEISNENKDNDDANYKLLKEYEEAIDYKNRNILILGIDARKNEPSRADTIILINMKEDKVNIISIPRDSRVSLKDWGKAKINASYAYGGIELSKKTVESLLNIKIDNYLVFNFKAIEKGVDALGGFTVNIPKNIKIYDSELKKTYSLEKGIHNLNGIQTLEYLRFRKDGSGDIGRIHRQQEFIKDLQESFLKLDNIPLIPRAFVAIHDDIKTDMNASDITYYFIHGYRLKDEFEYNTLRGRGEMINKVSYYILYENSIKNIRKILR